MLRQTISIYLSLYARNYYFTTVFNCPFSIDYLHCLRIVRYLGRDIRRNILGDMVMIVREGEKVGERDYEYICVMRIFW